MFLTTPAVNNFASWVVAPLTNVASNTDGLTSYTGGWDRAKGLRGESQYYSSYASQSSSFLSRLDASVQSWGLGELKVDCVQSKELLERFMAKTGVSLNLIIEKLCLRVEKTDSSQVPDTLLPIKSQAELDELEEKIGADPAFSRALIRKLSTFGGTSATKTIRTISRCMFDDNLLVDYSWFGTSNKKKFEAYRKIFVVMVEAVRVRFPNFSDAEGSSYLKTYLKQARFRLGKISLDAE